MSERIPPEDKQRLENTAAYLVRNPLSLNKLVLPRRQRAVIYKRFTFLNEGRGVARHPGLLCILGEGTVATTSGGISDASSINDPRPMVGYYDPHGVIHPNGVFAALGHAILVRPTKGLPLPLTIKSYAEDMGPSQPAPTGSSTGSATLGLLRGLADVDAQW